MARTKQTARKSTGGKAPRKLLACKGKGGFINYVTSQQVSGAANTGAAPAKKISYINYENTFRSFLFYPPHGKQTERCLAAQCATARTTTGSTEETWLGINLVSKWDGNGMYKVGRPKLNLMICLDISGSMGSSFSEDRGRSKLDIARECLKTVTTQLKPDDNFGIILFDHNTETLLSLSSWESVDKTQLFASLDKLYPRGGTVISAALKVATTELNRKPSSEENSTSRIIMLTDMETHGDQSDIMKILQQNTQKQIWSTVFGVDVDLSADLVNRISKVKGSKYVSATTPTEFRQILELEFPYDVTPAGFDIKFELDSSSPWVMKKGYGSPEISGLPTAGTNTVTLVTEFPSPHHDAEGGYFGNLFLFQLTKKDNTTQGSKRKGNRGKQTTGNNPEDKDKEQDKEDETVQLTFSYLPPGSSSRESSTETIRIPNDVSCGSKSLRKGIALVKFVDMQDAYLTSSTPSFASLPAAKKLSHHEEQLQHHMQFRDYFIGEMAQAADSSIADASSDSDEDKTKSKNSKNSKNSKKANTNKASLTEIKAPPTNKAVGNEVKNVWVMDIIDKIIECEHDEIVSLWSSAKRTGKAPPPPSLHPPTIEQQPSTTHTSTNPLPSAPPAPVKAEAPKRGVKRERDEDVVLGAQVHMKSEVEEMKQDMESPPPRRSSRLKVKA